MKTSAVILADSINEHGDRLTTLQITAPRMILAEINTHRVLSRNYRSSRAVPVATLIEEVRNDPFVPLAFTANKAGMQGGDILEGDAAFNAEACWRRAAYDAARHADWMRQLGVHKQFANRLLEPYLYVHGVISATEWENFFALRCHPDAQPEFQELAFAINAARAGSTPTQRGDNFQEVDNWHLPYIKNIERYAHSKRELQAMSAARCAWVSYKPFDENQENDMVKVQRTLGKLLSKPIHASPFEHVATPGNTHPSNYQGWVQLRHLVEEDPTIL